MSSSFCQDPNYVDEVAEPELPDGHASLGSMVAQTSGVGGEAEMMYSPS